MNALMTTNSHSIDSIPKTFYWIYSRKYIGMCAYTDNQLLMIIFIRQREDMGVLREDYILGETKKQSESEFIDWYNQYISTEYESDYAIGECSRISAWESSVGEIIACTDDEISMVGGESPCEPFQMYDHSELIGFIISNLRELYLLFRPYLDEEWMVDYKRFMSIVTIHVCFVVLYEWYDSVEESLNSIPSEIINQYRYYMNGGVIDQILDGTTKVYDVSDIIDTAEDIKYYLKALYC